MYNTAHKTNVLAIIWRLFTPALEEQFGWQNK
jgi:hypothetical protein